MLFLSGTFSLPGLYAILKHIIYKPHVLYSMSNCIRGCKYLSNNLLAESITHLVSYADCTLISCFLRCLTLNTQHKVHIDSRQHRNIWSPYLNQRTQVWATWAEDRWWDVKKKMDIFFVAYHDLSEEGVCKKSWRRDCLYFSLLLRRLITSVLRGILTLTSLKQFHILLRAFFPKCVHAFLTVGE